MRRYDRAVSNAEVSVPQSGIFALGTSSHAYLEFDLREPRTTIGGVNLVAGFRRDYFVPALSALRAFATAE